VPIILFFITLGVFVPALIELAALRYPKKKWLIRISAILILLGFWAFDPLVWRVHRRFPTAVITDCHDYGYLLPAFLHSYWTPANSLYNGYLDIRLENQIVDLNKFRDVPFFLLGLKHCKIVGALYTGDQTVGHVDVEFQDCDFTAASGAQTMGIKDLKHVTYDTDPE